MAAPAQGQSLQTIHVLSFASDAIKQVLYPVQAGLFSKLGFQVQLQTLGSGSAIISALVGGSGDFGSGSLFALFTAFGHGIPLRIVAPIALYDTNDWTRGSWCARIPASIKRAT